MFKVISGNNKHYVTYMPILPWESKLKGFQLNQIPDGVTCYCLSSNSVSDSHLRHKDTIPLWNGLLQYIETIIHASSLYKWSLRAPGSSRGLSWGRWFDHSELTGDQPNDKTNRYLVLLFRLSSNLSCIIFTTISRDVLSYNFLKFKLFFEK